MGLTSVDEALQGRIAGLDIVMNSGNLGAGTTMRLRGASTISTLTSSEPLIVVNGDVWNVDQSNFDVQNANDEQFAQLLNINGRYREYQRFKRCCCYGDLGFSRCEWCD